MKKSYKGKAFFCEPIRKEFIIAEFKALQGLKLLDLAGNQSDKCYHYL